MERVGAERTGVVDLARRSAAGAGADDLRQAEVPLREPARRLVAAGSPPLPPAGRVDDTTLSGGFIDGSGLPTDPVVLRKLLEARRIPGVDGPPGEAETFTLIGDMLRESYLPPAVRAAIYELTAELPGVELMGEAEDPVGRTGIGIAYVDRKARTRHELIFDPETSALLGERESTLGPRAFEFKAPRGTLIGYAAYLESRVVASVGWRAPAGAGALDHSVGCYDQASLHADTTVVHGADPIATCAKASSTPGSGGSNAKAGSTNAPKGSLPS